MSPKLTDALKFAGAMAVAACSGRQEVPHSANYILNVVSENDSQQAINDLMQIHVSNLEKCLENKGQTHSCDKAIDASRDCEFEGINRLHKAYSPLNSSCVDAAELNDQFVQNPESYYEGDNDTRIVVAAEACQNYIEKHSPGIIETMRDGCNEAARSCLAKTIIVKGIKCEGKDFAEDLFIQVK